MSMEEIEIQEWGGPLQAAPKPNAETAEFDYEGWDPDEPREGVYQ